LSALASLLYRLLHTFESGRIEVELDDGSAVLGVRRGWITAVRAPALASPLLRERLARVLTAARDARFVPLPSADAPSDLNAFAQAMQPGLLLREHVRADVSVDVDVDVDVDVVSKYAIDRSCLYPNEIVLAIALRAPRKIGDLRAQFPPRVVDNLLAFLASVDGLVGGARVGPRADLSGSHIVLGVAEGASRSEIRRAFLARAKAVHPDRHPGIAPDAFIELLAAYRALTHR
jgi:hypothetical protein